MLHTCRKIRCDSPDSREFGTDSGKNADCLIGCDKCTCAGVNSSLVVLVLVRLRNSNARAWLPSCLAT